MIYVIANKGITMARNIRESIFHYISSAYPCGKSKCLPLGKKTRKEGRRKRKEKRGKKGGEKEKGMEERC